MTALSGKLSHPQAFLIGAELVTTRGTLVEPRAARTVGFARELADYPRTDWVSITDNAGGNPMLAPLALGRPFRAAQREVVIHLSCKDLNRNALESTAWQLASEGFHNLLVLSGDATGDGVGGGAKQVFDIDSVGLLTLLGRMNAGLDITKAAAKQPAQLAPTNFFPGAAVTNFKLHENEVVPQLLKAERKIAAGARFFINQIGYDARKSHELITWLQQRGHGGVPLIGNVYMLSLGVARVFRAQRIPGVCVSEALAAVCERQGASPDKGRAFFLELAAKQVAIHRGLGYRGAYLGGVHTVADIDRVLEIERGFAPDDWRQFARELRYSRPGEFFFYAEDPATGLADPARLHPDYEASPRTRPATRNVTFSYRFSKFTHDLMFTPGKGLWNLGEKICRGAKDPMQGPPGMHAIEHLGKSLMFGCKDCGDCSLPDIAFLCPESSCAKNQRNGPCGGTRDGKCEVADFECIWARAYDRLKHEGREEQLLAHAPVIQNQNLRGTSSWANTWLGRDHLAKKLSVPLHVPNQPFNP
jgi:methylenetetrahydrofolate reductase (NADPH)